MRRHPGGQRADEGLPGEAATSAQLVSSQQKALPSDSGESSSGSLGAEMQTRLSIQEGTSSATAVATPVPARQEQAQRPSPDSSSSSGRSTAMSWQGSPSGSATAQPSPAASSTRPQVGGAASTHPDPGRAARWKLSRDLLAQCQARRQRPPPPSVDIVLPGNPNFELYGPERLLGPDFRARLAEGMGRLVYYAVAAGPVEDVPSGEAVELALSLYVSIIFVVTWHSMLLWAHDTGRYYSKSRFSAEDIAAVVQRHGLAPTEAADLQQRHQGCLVPPEPADYDAADFEGLSWPTFCIDENYQKSLD